MKYTEITYNEYGNIESVSIKSLVRDCITSNDCETGALENLKYTNEKLVEVVSTLLDVLLIHKIISLNDVENIVDSYKFPDHVVSKYEMGDDDE